MPTQDETPTVEIEEPTLTMDMIDSELELWRARFTLARKGAGKYDLPTCVQALDNWLDRKLDARGR